MEKNRKAACAVATAALGVYVVAGRSFFEKIVHYKKREEASLDNKRFRLSHLKVNHPRYQYGDVYEAGKAWCMAQSQNMKHCYIRSADGLRLHAYYFPTKAAKRYVLLFHGYKGHIFSEFANIAQFLHEHNCNLLFVDQRCCGLSEGEYITFGAREKDDVRRWSYFVSKRNKEKLPIYLFGESMGAASVLMSSEKKLPEEVSGLISDCGFQSMRSQIRELASKWFHLPSVELLLFRLSVWCRLAGGFGMGEADTSRALLVNNIPVLFFHGADDTYVYPRNSIDNYKICHAPKELVIVQGARHLCSAYADSELYRKKIMQFFAKYD